MRIDCKPHKGGGFSVLIRSSERLGKSSALPPEMHHLLQPYVEERELDNGLEQFLSSEPLRSESGDEWHLDAWVYVSGACAVPDTLRKTLHLRTPWHTQTPGEHTLLGASL